MTIEPPNPVDPGSEAEPPSGETSQPVEAFESSPDEPSGQGQAPLHKVSPPAPPPPDWMSRFAHPRSLLTLGLISLLLLLVAGLAAWYLLSSRPEPPGVQANVTPPASLAELATEFPQMSSVLTDPALDSAYKDFLMAYQEGGLDAAYALAETRGLLNANGDIRLTLELDTTDTQELQAQLQQYGVIITAQHGNEIDIVIPRQLLEQMVASDDPATLFENLTGMEHIIHIRLPIPNTPDQIGIQTESLPVIGADVWHAAGITGKGVKVGVLDRGFDTYQKLLGTDLPAQVTARSFIAGQAVDGTGEVHGAAVAEIIYDIAPDAQLYFAAFDTEVEQREAIDWLVSQGVDIISQSAGSVYGPMNGTSPIAVYVDQVVGDGILWVNSSGNTAYTHYRGTFTDTDGDGYHEFAPGDEMMDFIPNGRTIFVLNWDDWGRGLEDFDLFITDANGKVIASSTNIQDGPEDDSAELIVYTFTDSNVYYLSFYAKRSTRPVVFDFFMRDGQIQYYTPEHSVTTPGDARRSLTVGATNWSDDKLEDFSGQGPTSDGRLKPDLVAPDNVSSAAYGKTWEGTSAATPHVSGAAALVLQAFPNMTPDQVADFLRQRSKDLGPTGPDTATGFGRLSLGEPPDLSALAPTSPATEAAALPPKTSSSTPEQVLLTTPIPGKNQGGTMGLIVALLACVAAPGVLGLVGIGLFATVWHTRRTRPAPPPRRPRQPTVWSPASPSDNPFDAELDAYPPAYPPVPPAAGPADEAQAPAAQAGEAPCPRCGTMHRAGARFCSACGLALDPTLFPPEEKVFCTHCGKQIRASSRFCPYCGHERGQGPGQKR